MVTINLSWAEFLKEAEEFFQLSQRLNDNWEFIRKDECEGNAYLSYKKKFRSRISFDVKRNFDEDDIKCDVTSERITHNESNAEEVLLMEYHVIYSISYQVPVLYFRVQRSDGGTLEMEQIWEIFCASNDDKPDHRSRADMLTVLTQMEHPVLFKPFYAMHPCRTAELLGQTLNSRNRILTFISIMGPYMQLNLDNQYGNLAE